MPSYFFHLLFELHKPTSSIARSLPELSEISESQLASFPAYIPPQHSNIFSSLPAHSSPQILRTPIFINAAASTLHYPTPQKKKRKPRKEKSKAAKPTSDAEPVQVPPTPESPTTHRTTTSYHRDWRFDRITIDSIDMASEPTSFSSASTTATKRLKPSAATTASAAKAHFIPVETKSTEFGYGVVHLYRDLNETPGLYNPPSKEIEKEEREIDEVALTTVAILAVPSYMTPADFMGFVGEGTRDAVSHFRMIRTGKANRYMVLMKFRRREDARVFVKEFNGKVFNSMEPENCHVVFIKSLQFHPAPSIAPTNLYPELTNDPFSPSNPPTPATSAMSTKPVPPPTPNLLELPTCPVCLERMDETTGLLTILCQHVFHCACLSKWKDSSCPVCRYTQSPSRFRREEDPEAETCNVCGADENLWICLICGNVGCGRYDDAHAFAHYEATGHSYAMDISTQRVWDYVGDGYVHRLIQNKSDGKLVELPSALSHPPHSQDGGNGEYVPREKLDGIGMEYTYLLTSQLESQRLYFEEKMTLAADKLSTATSSLEKALSDSQALKSELEELTGKYEELKQILPCLEKDKNRAENKAEKFSEMARRMEKEWKEEKGVSQGLMEKIEFLQKGMDKAKTEREELKEQVRDLMFFVEAREKMKGEGEDVVGGTLVVGDAKETGKKKKGKGRR
ncbi:hypothetical protein RUND412_011369 [Rhizina undulata]